MAEIFVWHVVVVVLKQSIRCDIRIESEVWNVLNSVLCRCKIFKFYPNSLNEEKVKGKTLQFYLLINTKWALILKKKMPGNIIQGPMLVFFTKYYLAIYRLAMSIWHI